MAVRQENSLCLPSIWGACEPAGQADSAAGRMEEGGDQSQDEGPSCFQELVWR